jgi:hypothetical protein
MGINPVGTSIWACKSPEEVVMERFRRSVEDGIIFNSRTDGGVWHFPGVGTWIYY